MPHKRFSVMSAAYRAAECATGALFIAGTSAALLGALEAGDMPLTVFFLLASLAALIGLVGGYLQRSDVLVDDQGISYTSFGRIWKTIRWESIKRIRVTQSIDVESAGSIFTPCKMDVYTLYSTDAKWHLLPSGPISFTARIDDVRELLDIINARTEGHDAEIFDERTKGMAVRLQRL